VWLAATLFFAGRGVTVAKYLSEVVELLAKVRRALQIHKMVRAGELVLVAVSGGPDSSALLHALWTLQQEFGYQLQAAHINHLLRGEEALADSDYVRELAAQLQIPVMFASINVGFFAHLWGQSIQVAARRLRYSCLHWMAKNCGANKIALGHHRDDQAETVLFRFLRGTGLDGLGGMKPVLQDRLIRPLLWVSKGEITEYLRQHRLSSRQDSSNEKRIYTRNKIRLELIPHLEKEYNARFQEAAVRLADLCREEADFLNELAWNNLQAAELRDDKQEVLQAFDLLRMQAAPRSLLRRMVRMAFQKASTGKSLQAVHVENVVRLLEHGQTGEEISLPYGIIIQREAKRLVFLDIHRISAPGIPVTQLPIPGRLELPGGVIIKAEIRVFPPGRALQWVQAKACPQMAVLDYHSVQLPLVVRSRLPGDRFRPLGQGGSKKLQDFLVDSKVPHRMRNNIPVCLDQRGIVWLAGYQIDERVKVGPESQKIIVLQLNSPSSSSAD
jgi:tRNA(Ile)-lysidine synthase